MTLDYDDIVDLKFFLHKEFDTPDKREKEAKKRLKKFVRAYKTQGKYEIVSVYVKIIDNAGNTIISWKEFPYVAQVMVVLKEKVKK